MIKTDKEIRVIKSVSVLPSVWETAQKNLGRTPISAKIEEMLVELNNTYQEQSDDIKKEGKKQKV